MTTQEDLVRTQLVAEMVAEGILERDGEVLMIPAERSATHAFMVEVKVLDVTNAKEMT